MVHIVGRISGFLPFLSLKVKVIARLEFELAYYDVAVQNVSHYTMGLISL